jgi:hypothetical protein
LARWLSLHTSYACRHAGACCSSGWPIPLERDRVPKIVRAIEAGQIEAPEPWLLPVIGQPPEVAGVLTEVGGRCLFRHPVAGELRCAIHSALGHDAIPIACQHFPRVCLIDDRGVSVTLSHYCPTAASLLDSYEGPVEIVEGPEPMPTGELEGLDARGAWPPLLAPNVLMDLAAYTQWEAHLISWLGGGRNPDGEWAPEDVLHMLHGQARRLASWRPGDRPLAEAIARLASDRQTAIGAPDWDREQRLRTAAIASLPPSQEDGEVDDLPHVWSRDVADAWRRQARIVNRFLAAHAFAAWNAYQADGLVTGVRLLQLTLAVLRGESARLPPLEGGELTRDRLRHAIRQTDRLLIHLVDRAALAARLSRSSRDLDLSTQP